MKHVIVYGKGPTKEIMIEIAKKMKKKPVLVMIGNSGLKVEELLSYEDVYDSKKAIINLDKCDRCGECLKACQKGAISEDFKVNWDLCEGCPACYYSCPLGAIDFKIVKSGEIRVFISEGVPIVEYAYAPWINRYVFARHVRDIAKRLAADENTWIIEEGWHPMPWAFNIRVDGCDDPEADLVLGNNCQPPSPKELDTVIRKLEVIL